MIAPNTTDATITRTSVLARQGQKRKRERKCDGPPEKQLRRDLEPRKGWSGSEQRDDAAWSEEGDRQREAPTHPVQTERRQIAQRKSKRGGELSKRRVHREDEQRRRDKGRPLPARHRGFAG